MGLVSALLAGFELAALVEVDLDDGCNERGGCTAEGGFVVAASYCVGLSTIVVLETSFEYMFIMRELHHGNKSAWALLEAFKYCRRTAEVLFALEIIMFLISTALLVHVRFARLLPASSVFAQVLIVINFMIIFVVVAMLQQAKRVHGVGRKLKREERKERMRRRREEQERGGCAPHKRRSIGGGLFAGAKRGSGPLLPACGSGKVSMKLFGAVGSNSSSSSIAGSSCGDNLDPGEQAHRQPGHGQPNNEDGSMASPT